MSARDCEPNREMQRRGRIRYATREEAKAARAETYRKHDLKGGTVSYSAEYQRARRADPEYAQRQRELSLAAKRRRRGVCEDCGGETRYNGKTVNGPSSLCGKCNLKRNHDSRRWTRDSIVRAFQRFRDETGRVPRALDAQGLPESAMPRLSGLRIRELEQMRELGLVLPTPGTVKREFGSWSAGIVAAGMPVSRGGGGTHRKRF